MPAMGILQRFMVVQTPTVEYPLVNMAATLEHEAESKHHYRYQYMEISERLKSEKENSPEKRPMAKLA